MALEQAELHRSAGGLGAGATVELGQDVADVHVDGAWAEEQPLGDLAVGAPDRDQAQPSTSRRDRPACSSSPAARRRVGARSSRRGGRAPRPRRLPGDGYEAGRPVGGRRSARGVRRVRARGCRGSETVWSRQPPPRAAEGEVRAMLTAIEAALDGEWWPRCRRSRALPPCHGGRTMERRRGDASFHPRPGSNPWTVPGCGWVIGRR
jgi:hypothetical protein